MGAFGPGLSAGNGLLHSSPLEAVVGEAKACVGRFNGWIVLVGNGVGDGISVGGIGVSVGVSSLPSLRTLGLFLAMCGASAVGYYAYERSASSVRPVIETIADRISLPRPPGDVLNILAAPLNGLLWVGDRIQGEAGLLWILFLLLVLAAIVGRGS